MFGIVSWIGEITKRIGGSGPQLCGGWSSPSPWAAGRHPNPAPVRIFYFPLELLLRLSFPAFRVDFALQNTLEILNRAKFGDAWRVHRLGHKRKFSWWLGNWQMASQQCGPAFCSTFFASPPFLDSNQALSSACSTWGLPSSALSAHNFGPLRIFLPIWSGPLHICPLPPSPAGSSSSGGAKQLASHFLPVSQCFLFPWSCAKSCKSLT